MPTVLNDDDLPTPDELDRLADALLAGGALGPAGAEQAAQVLREVAVSLRRPQVAERISDEGFD